MSCVVCDVCRLVSDVVWSVMWCGVVCILCGLVSDVVWCGLQLDGDIDDCACSVESLDFFNNEEVFPIIDELMLRNYFRYYKVTSVCHPRPVCCQTNKHPFNDLFQDILGKLAPDTYKLSWILMWQKMSVCLSHF